MVPQTHPLGDAAKGINPGGSPAMQGSGAARPQERYHLWQGSANRMAKPVVFIPGLPGSHLLDEVSRKRLFLDVPDSFDSPNLERLRGPDILNSSDGVTAGAPVGEIEVTGALGQVLAFFVDLKRAASFYDLLRPLYSPGDFADHSVRFGWDWRRPVWDPITQDALARAILVLRARLGPVVVVAHSTGGLVLRHLLEDDTQPLHDPVLAAIDHIIAFGVPWAGTLKSFETLTGQRGLSGLLTPSAAREVLGRSWAAFDLLPPDPAEIAAPPLVVEITPAGRVAVSPLLDRRWLPAGDEAQDLRTAMGQRADGTLAGLGQPAAAIHYDGPPIGLTNVVGWGFETTLLATLTPVGEGVEVGFVSDAAKAGLDPTDDGDGTVPRRSAAWLEGPEVSTFHVPIGRGVGGVQQHITLWGNAGGRNLLRHHVAGTPMEPFVYATVDRSDGVSGGDRVQVRCAANDSHGALLDGASARFTDPATGEQSFDPGLDGRLLLEIPRQDLRPVSNQLRRLEIEISWRQGAAVRRRRFGFFVAR
jgi:hypothetical protein